MSVSITHAKVSGRAAGNDPNRIYGSHWDADHVVPIATEEQARAGIASTVLMTPERVAQAIDELASDSSTLVSSEAAFGTDNVLVRSDGTGRGTQATGITASDANNLSGIAALSATTIELGHASDTTISRTGAGAIAVEGVGVALNSTSLAHTASTIELGHASDTTLSRSAAGIVAVEGADLLKAASQTISSANQSIVRANINVQREMFEHLGDYVVGNGTSDDTTPVENAITALGSSGGVIWVPPGATVYTGQIIVPSNITFAGAGDTSIFKMTAGGSSADFQFRAFNKSNIHFRNLKFIGNSTGASQTSIALEGVDGFSIVNCFFDDLGGRAIRVVYDFTNSAASKHGVIAHNRLTDVGDIAIFLKTAVTDTVVLGNIIRAVGAGGSDTFSNGIAVDDGSSGDASYIASERVVVANNVLEGLGGDSTARGINISGGKDIQVSANIIKNCGGSVGSGAGFEGIMVNNGGGSPDLSCERVSVTNNKLYNIGGNGIRIEDSVRTFVSGNTIDTYGVDSASAFCSGVLVYDDNVDTVVTNNHIIAGTGADYGIDVSSSTNSGTVVYANIIDANGIALTAEFRDNGTGTINSMQADGQIY